MEETPARGIVDLFMEAQSQFEQGNLGQYIEICSGYHC